MVGSGQAREHVGVIGADEDRVGAVDRVQGERIRLMKRDSGDQHTASSRLDGGEVEAGTVRLSANADVAVTMEEGSGGRRLRADSGGLSDIGEALLRAA